MRRHANHIECSNRKPLDFEDNRWCTHRRFLDHEESTKGIWSHRQYGLDRDGLYMYKRNDTYSMCEWRRLRSVFAFDTSLTTFMWLILFTWNVNLRKVWPNKTLFSLRIIAVNIVHLYSKSLMWPERCMCEKEVIRTACASFIDQCRGAPAGAQ